MSQSLRPDDLVIGALGQNFLGKVKALVAGANAVSKGDSVVVTSLSFGPRGTPRAGQVTRATAAPDGLVMIASNDAAVGRQVVLVDWLPLQFDTSAAAAGDPVYIAADGSPTLALGTVIVGAVVDVGTIANGGSIILKGPGVV